MGEGLAGGADWRFRFVPKQGTQGLGVLYPHSGHYMYGHV
jgi:hypothetical protein